MKVCKAYSSRSWKLIQRGCGVFFLLSFLLSFGFLACVAEEAVEAPADAFVPGQGLLPTEANLESEWAVYRSQHTELSEDVARHRFAQIQSLSQAAHELYGNQAKRVALWADRRSLARAWLKSEIEELYHPRDVDDAFIQQAIDAYAFDSGGPALTTASHILLQPNSRFSAEQCRDAMTASRLELLSNGDLSDLALARTAFELLRLGFQVDMNANLSFPRHPIPSFMGQQHSAMPVVEPFAAAAFALTEETPLSDVVESEFGYHLILFKQRTAETKGDIEDLRDFMRQKIVEQGRHLGTQQALSQLQSAAEIRVDEKSISEAIRAGQ